MTANWYTPTITNSDGYLVGVRQLPIAYPTEVLHAVYQPRGNGGTHYSCRELSYELTYPDIEDYDANHYARFIIFRDNTRINTPEAGAWFHIVSIGY